MNGEIEHDRVRVSAWEATSTPGKTKEEALGVMPVEEALAMAKERGVDLILVSESGDVPICKLVEYSKWRYVNEKKKKEVKKNSKSTEVKEIKMSYKIDTGDLQVRQKNCIKFLKAGNRVKVSVQFKGREQSHLDLGFSLLDRFSEGCSEWGVTEGKPKREGRGISMMITARQEKIKKMRDEEKAKLKRKKKEERQAVQAGASEEEAEAENSDEQDSDPSEQQEEEQGLAL